MKTHLSDFVKTKDYLICIDSDGCAMDTMEVKHRKCFAPIAVDVWHLNAMQERFFEIWHYNNLYSKTRGINRFKGLLKTFEDTVSEGYDLPNFNALKNWVMVSEELSNPSLIKEIEKNNDKQLETVLLWSQKVNEAIKALVDEDKPFPNVSESLSAIHPYADIAIVSSANGMAVYEEWTKHGFSPYVEVMCGQEAGSKSFCIEALKSKGKYFDNNVLMIGDAPSDYEAAKENGVLFYPIIAGKEALSWSNFVNEGLAKFLEGTFAGIYQELLINNFNTSLK